MPSGNRNERSDVTSTSAQDTAVGDTGDVNQDIIDTTIDSSVDGDLADAVPPDGADAVGPPDGADTQTPTTDTDLDDNGSDDAMDGTDARRDDGLLLENAGRRALA